ncbi:phage tail protein [Alteromonadaceae bacterium M269]|nr:phage tail protein [Alteromonadaceae bacterium M269]
MAGNRILMKRRLILNTYEVGKEVAEYTPPKVVKIMKDSEGGHFGKKKIFVGIEEMSSSLKILGPTKDFLSNFGIVGGQSANITVIESLQDEDGEIFAIRYEKTGEIVSVEESQSKMGEEKYAMLEMHVRAYKKTENGGNIYDINVDADYYDLGDGDIMAPHTRNVS